jgi:hypothetical protein
MFRYSIKKLVENVSLNISHEIPPSGLSPAIMDLCCQLSLRSQHQLKHLNSLSNLKPKTLVLSNPINTLVRVYKDTSLTLDRFYASGNQNQLQFNKKHVQDTFDMLSARHGLTIETFSEIHSHIMPKDLSKSGDCIINNFLRTHVSVWVLLQQCLDVLIQFPSESPNDYVENVKINQSVEVDKQRVGCVVLNANINDICADARLQAITLADHNHGYCPPIIFSCNDTVANAKLSSVANKVVTTAAIPSMIRFIVLELLKNAIYSTLKQQEKDGIVNRDENFDDIDYAVCVDVMDDVKNNNVVITISDSGTGFTAIKGDFNEMIHHMQHQFRYGANKTMDELAYSQHASYQPMSSPLNGCGVGLYVATLFATHFGGNLMILPFNRFNSNNNRGVTAILTIPRDTSIQEPVEML